MQKETKQLIGLYAGGQVVFLLLGIWPGLLFPPLFFYWLWRAKRELGQ